MRQTVIVGGGISGLSCAYHLAKAGFESTIIESRARLGGVIHTEKTQGCVIEAGPDSFLSLKPSAMELIGEVGLAGDVIGSNDHLRKTYVWKNRRLVPLPDGLMMMVPTRIAPLVTTRLLGWPTKIRMGMEWFRSPSGTAREDRSVADFIRDHYGSEAVDYLAEPLLAGIYGGNPSELSVSSVLPRFVEFETKYGSLTKGVLAERKAVAKEGAKLPLFRTLKGGLGQLVEAVASAIGSKLEFLRGTAESIEADSAGFRIRVNGEWIGAGNVVLACEAYQAAKVIDPLDAKLAELLDAVPYSSSMTMTLGFSKSGFDHPLDGFGFLVPRRERRRLVACTWLGTKFSHRVPDDLVVLRCFMGGAEGADTLSESDDTLTEAAMEELRDIMGITARPIFTRISRWPRSMAQYTVGHNPRVEEIFARLEPFPGLHLAGNAYQGIGIPDCVRMGKQAAEKILQAK